MAIAMLSVHPPGSLLTCNGYKDTEYMELVRRRTLVHEMTLAVWNPSPRVVQRIPSLR